MAARGARAADRADAVSRRADRDVPFLNKNWDLVTGQSLSAAC
jgi:hypothetical protein